ncbi:stage III sporulation protein AC [Desulfuribacillus stibiiarsenatis]|uniref:Stage III sporulation protein AC n=1 Tax=Desulfuribacillus stibiiarsenatis TaxID=1390249 RepID=A0A1E5L6A5_9FIRM|nr:stage III sporulation protein AC [Desulfuribacillus stibiiarsenatis]OEH85651.1 stage III sporulation protein AC [Desulfuribacillus stibiiarsenatis]
MYEVDAIFKIAGIGIAIAFIHTILKQAGKEEIAHWTTLIGFIIIIFMVATKISDLFQTIRQTFLLQ